MRGRVELSPSTWSQPFPPAITPTRMSVLGHIVDRVQACGDRRGLVAVDGRTAAGKTIVGHEVAEADPLSRADIVVDNTRIDEPRILRS